MLDILLAIQGDKTGATKRVLKHAPEGRIYQLHRVYEDFKFDTDHPVKREAHHH